MSDYEDMCKRLVSYRKSFGLYQQRLGELLGVTQEQYSYIEHGATKITDAHLRVFSKLGMDIDFLVIGEPLEEGGNELEAMYELFPDKEDREFAMKIVAEISLKILEKTDVHKLTKADKNMLTLLEAYIEEWNNFSMMTFVRFGRNKSQTDMAQQLGIGIKKYRAFEKETRFPDAELLIELYQMSGYPPSMFLDIYDRKMLLLKRVWRLLDEKSKKVIMDLVRTMRLVV